MKADILLPKELQSVVGAWVRDHNFIYHSSQSELDSEMMVYDVNKTYSIVSSKNRTVFWKKLMKYDSKHYLGEDVDSSTAHWTILGNHLRFIWVMAYKQNPKAHSRILAFGDFNDLNDGQTKTFLIGYNTTFIGDVGFNKMFEYFESTFSDQGILQLSIKSQQPSGIGWLHSNKIGELDYLHGTKDCGQHRYPIPSPLS